ncbi:amidohydrolase [Streptomyces sp. SID13666]|uniref:M20 metallopeptidase family protein n=1 Tax=unclassified Streptomyces TaxID=2593676 RepID=UPI0013C1E0AB|nr:MULTISPECIES: M20 family metallopeptidase [unclassified Streptomyces]NEA53728.1 amidohydrolase [Streptomyces sp. SID13666]NEA71506.1 amidohydrolase [Streptomyces sp. SID13588]
MTDAAHRHAGLRRSAATFQAELVALRRALHREPEIGLDLPLTQARVLAALEGLPLEITLGKQLSSVTAVLRGALPGPVVLLRGDMDALPVQESNDVPYASAVAGVMHACGHDLHTAALVGAVRLLCERRDELAGTVVFMFQPGEEGLGGARLMIEEGVLEAAGSRPVAAYALHVAASQLPNGWVATRPGPIMAAADTLTATMHGRGGHGSSPHLALDPIPAACAAVTALQTMVTRRFDAFDPVVVSVGSFHAGTAENVIPDEAVFGATIRSFSPEARARVLEEAPLVVQGIGRAHGLTVEAVVTEGYPVTVNDPEEMAFAAETARQLLGAGRYLDMPRPVAGSEDFAVVAELVPSAYLMLGACPADRDPSTAAYNHSPQAAFDDCVLGDAAALLAELALGRTVRG